LRNMAPASAGGPGQASTSPTGDGKAASQAKPKSTPQAVLESDWTSFETHQDLQELRRKMQR